MYTHSFNGFCWVRDFLVSLVEKSLSFFVFLSKLRRKFYGIFLKPGHNDDHGAVEGSNPSDNGHLSDNDPHSQGNKTCTF